VTIPTSYLKTLPQADAVTFVDSLQKVKAHLQDELEGMNAQLHQKTQQLESIEAILAEAVSIGVVANDAIVPPPMETTTESQDASAYSALDAPRVTSHAPTNMIGEADSAIGASTQPRGGRRPEADLKPQRRGNQKPATAKAKPPKSSIHEDSQQRESGEGRELGQFLQAEFRDKLLIASIAQVLSNSQEPLETDDIMAELYAGLSSKDYNRAKRSVANLLSLGKRKGKWQSVGRGRYTGN